MIVCRENAAEAARAAPFRKSHTVYTCVLCVYGWGVGGGGFINGQYPDSFYFIFSIFMSIGNHSVHHLACLFEHVLILTQQTHSGPLYDTCIASEPAGLRMAAAIGDQSDSDPRRRIPRSLISSTGTSV